MKIITLTNMMEHHAKCVVKGPLTDSIKLDIETIRKTHGKVRFIWQINDNESFLYLYSDPDWEKVLLEVIESQKQTGINCMYFYYNKGIRLMSKWEVRFIASRRLKVKQNIISTNDSIINKKLSKYEKKQELARYRSKQRSKSV